MKLSKQQELQEEEYATPYQYLMSKSNLIAFPNKLIISPDYVRTLERIIDLVKPFNGQKLLDAGCGDGRFIHELGKMNIVAQGIDYSERAIGFANTINPQARFDVGSLTETLPYEDETFDQIVSIETLEHINPDLVDKAVKELSRVLKKGGHLIVTVPHENRKLDAKHCQHFSAESLEHILGNVFEVKEISWFHNKNFILNLFYTFIVIAYYYLYPLTKIKLGFITDGLNRLGYGYFKSILENCSSSNGFTLICSAKKI